MKLHDRRLVEGTTPAIYIGHRQYRSKEGLIKISKPWYCEYTHQGSKRSEPLRTPNLKVATQSVWKIVQRLEQGDERHVRRRVDWQQFIDAYVSLKLNQDRAPKTIEKYRYVLHELASFAQSIGRPTPAAFRAADYWAFNGYMTEKGLYRKTRADRMTIVKQLFRWGHLKGKTLSTNPLTDEEIPKAESRPQPCFTPEQVRQLLGEADPHEAAIYTMLAYAGLRVGEARDLLWSDIDLNQGSHGWITVRRGGSGELTKGKRSRSIPIHQELKRVLVGMPSRTGRVFCSRPSSTYPEGDGPISERRLLRSLKRLCKRCGFSNPNQYKVHTWRHVFASMLARRRVSLKHALELMGVKNSRIYDIYFKLFDEDAEAAINHITFTEQGLLLP